MSPNRCSDVSVLTFSVPTLVHFSFSAVAAKSEDIMMLIMTSSLVCLPASPPGNELSGVH